MHCCLFRVGCGCFFEGWWQSTKSPFDRERYQQPPWGTWKVLWRRGVHASALSLVWHATIIIQALLPCNSVGKDIVQSDRNKSLDPRPRDPPRSTEIHGSTTRSMGSIGWPYSPSSRRCRAESAPQPAPEWTTAVDLPAEGLTDVAWRVGSGRCGSRGSRRRGPICKKKKKKLKDMWLLRTFTAARRQIKSNHCASWLTILEQSSTPQ